MSDAPISISVEMTANPDIENFIILKELIKGELYEYKTKEEAKNSPLAQKLFLVKGIKSLKITPFTVFVTREKGADWILLEEEIEEVLREHLLSGEPVVNEKNSHLQIVVKPEKPAALHLGIELTPNPNTKKWNVSTTLVASTHEFNQPSSNSPLVEKIFALKGVTNILIAPHYISISKTEAISWEELEEKASKIITEYLASKEPLIKKEAGNQTLSVAEGSTEEKIQNVLENEIRPMIAMDGGDVSFIDYQEGVVSLKLRGACKGCPSSTLTLKQGIENRLKQVVPEIMEVIQV